MNIKTILIGTGCFLVFYISTYWIINEIKNEQSSYYSLNKEVYSGKENKYELQLIYIGSSTCKFCNVPTIPQSVNDIRNILFIESQKHGLGFSMIGISKDHVITEGLKHLSKVGKFNEITTGKGWQNVGILRYVYGEIPGRAATPQILVILREYRVIVMNQDEDNFYRGIKTEKLLTRKIGVSEITSWAKQDAYLPEDALTVSKTPSQ